MMVFISIYGVVDGFFVSNFVGQTAFTAVNFVMPILMVLGAIGFMIGSGGSALISKTLGEGDPDKANRIFSLFVCFTLGVGIAVSAVVWIFLREILSAFGATGEMLDNCVLYGRVILCALPAQMLQFEFQSFFVTAEKPYYGFWFTLTAGCANILLDAILVGAFRCGLVGAAIATGISHIIGGVCPIFYFLRKGNSSLLRLGKVRFDGKALLRACGNGSSEFLSNVALSAVAMLYNVQLMRYAGEPGVAAYGVLMYVNFVFLSCFIGYSVGVAPIVGFNFGARNKEELKNVLKKSLTVIACGAAAMLILAQTFAAPVANLFVGYNADLQQMTVRGFLIFSFGFLFAGWSIFSSSFFTALNNGLISAVISFLRTLVFQVASVLLLPLVFERLGGDPLDGIWLSIVVAEVVAAVVSWVMLLCNRKRYGY